MSKFKVGDRVRVREDAWERDQASEKSEWDELQSEMQSCIGCVGDVVGRHPLDESISVRLSNGESWWFLSECLEHAAPHAPDNDLQSERRRLAHDYLKELVGCGGSAREREKWVSECVKLADELINLTGGLVND